jgi:hypothetical protein
VSVWAIWVLSCDAHDCEMEFDVTDAYPSRVRRAARATGWHTDSHKGALEYCPQHADMSRLLVAAAVTLTGLVALPHESNPEVTVSAPSLVRPVPHRASRGMRRAPLFAVSSRSSSGKDRRARTSRTPAPRQVAAPAPSVRRPCRTSRRLHSASPAAIHMLWTRPARTSGSTSFRRPAPSPPMGGHGNPADASPAEQTYRAGLLYADRGTPNRGPS